MEPKEGYGLLHDVLIQALEQAQSGKGKVRHAKENEFFEDQPICEIGRRLGTGYNLGQAVKKIYESQRLDDEGAVKELLGAVNYIASAIILINEKKYDILGGNV